MNGFGMRGRFSYSRFGGFQGFGGSMGDPASSAGGHSLSRMAGQSTPGNEPADPLWQEIEGTFHDILGEYANMNLDMPIRPPDMKDPSDQLRYLKDLEALGMSSAPSAALMGSNIRAATQFLTEQSKAQKQMVDMMFKLLPALDESPDVKAFIATNLLNTLMPGAFDIGEKPGLEWGPPEKRAVRLSPENATEGELYHGISAMTMGKASELAKAGDKEGLRDYLDALYEQLVAAKIRPEIATTIVNKIHADSLTAAKAEEPVY